MSILVTGGTGFIGGHLVRALLVRGERVRFLGRNAERARSLIAAGAEFYQVDLRDQDGVQAACRGVELVYHIGALSTAWGRWPDFAGINGAGTAAVLAGCLAHGVQRLVYVSSPGVVFDGTDQLNVTEAAPYPARSVSFYTESKKRAELLVRSVDQNKLETVIIRPKAVFGPGDTTLLPSLIAAARRGRLPQIGTGNNLVDLTYVKNVVTALILAGTAPKAVGQIYHITNGEHVPLWPTIRTLLQRLQINHTPRPLPVTLALRLAHLLELRARLTGTEPLLTRYSVLVLGRSQTYDISAAQRDLGYTPLVSVATGIEFTLAELSAQHQNER